MRLCKVLLALGIVALVCAPALAQGRRGGGGQGGGFGMLVANKSVQDELKIDKDQATKAEDALKKVREELKDDYAKLGGRRGGGNNVSDEERTAARKKTSEAEEKALGDVLKPDQLKRLHQIRRQQEGVAMFTNADVEKALKLTDDQKTKLKAINDDYAKERRELFAGGKPGPDAQAKMQALRKDAMSNATKALTDDQKKTLKDLTGEPFEIKFDRQGGKPRTDF
jgi:Spy/CpxP family protein refolding chaperone